MAHEKKVRDLMIPIDEYSTISDRATVREAVQTLVNSFVKTRDGEYSGHRSVLVLDDRRRPVGLLTFRDLIRAVEPRLDPAKVPGGSLPWAENATALPLEGYFTTRSRQEANHPVREVMRPLKLITVDADASLMQAVQIMVSHDIGTLPVLEKGEVVGMLRINELFMEIAGAVGAAPGGSLPGEAG